MNKTDDKLRSEIDANETRGERGAWAVVVGLVLEIAIALAVSFNIDTKWFDNWGAVLADCLIAGGVYAEIHFGRRASHGNAELRRRSEEKVAAANKRAAEAELQAEKIRKEVSWRRVSAQEAEKISEILGRADVPKFGLRIIHPVNDPEAVTFSQDLAEVFKHNGWPVLLVATTETIPPGMMIPLYAAPDLDACGITRAAIANAGIEFKGGYPERSGGMSMASGDEISGPAAVIFVGAREPPNLGSSTPNTLASPEASMA